MWIGGIPPLLAAVAMVFILPSEKNVEPFSDDKAKAVSATGEVKKGSWGEMLQGANLRITVTCLALAGLNFYGYQFFNGFVTTYLKEVRLFDGTTMGIIFSISAAGSLIGAWCWGAIADKWGRKCNAFGFILAILGFVYNFGLSSSAVWGGYFAEMFPAHLRSFGAALFHGGRILGMWAPMVLVFIQERSDLTTAMWGSPIVWILGGMLWLTLPETLKTGLFARKNASGNGQAATA